MRLFRRRPRNPKSPLALWQQFFCLSLVVAPPVVLGFQGANAVIRQIDGVLAQAAPLVSAEVSRTLKREIRVGRLESDLTTGGIIGLIRRRSQFGSVPVNAYDITVANGETIAGSGLLATARQVTIDLNVPALLSGQVTTRGVPRVTVFDPYLLLIRNKDGTFNVMDLLPPKEPNQPPSEPFRTYVAVENARVTFRDYQTRVATATTPAVNFVQIPEGFADLMGSRELRFGGQARAQPGTVTQKRLAGIVRVSGELGRGLPSVRPKAPSEESARYLVRLSVGGASAAYWLPYFVPVPSFTVTGGIADVEATLAAPRPPAPGQSNPSLGIALGARFREGRVIAKELAAPLTDAAGTLDFSEGTLNFDATGRVIGQPVSGSGTVWNLTAPDAVSGRPVDPKTLPQPQLAVTVNAPQIPVQAALKTFLPKTAKLPPGLKVSGIARVNAAVNGPVNQPTITAVAALPAGLVTFRDLPQLTNLAANITFTQGLLGVTNATAQVVGGGTVRGRIGVRVAPGPRGSEAEQGNAVFAARVEKVALEKLAVLRNLTSLKNAKRPLRLSGIGSAEITGKQVAGAVSAAANLRTSGLTVSGIAFPVASARVIYDKGVVSLPWARVLSSAGAATVRGGLGQNGALSLRFALSNLDIDRLTSAIGIENIGGTLTATGTVSGTASAPRVLVERAVALNLKFQTPPVPAQNGKPAAPERTYALDTVTARDVLVTKSDLFIKDPVLFRRYPAVAAVTGRISNLTSAGGRSPRLALVARVSNLDYTEVLRQLGIEPQIPIVDEAANAPKPLIIPTPNAKNGSVRPNNPLRGIITAAAETTSKAGAAFSGFVTESTIRVTGPVNAPSISGAAQLGRLLIGPYPIDAGYIRFAYGPEGASVPEVRLRASVGVITASATVDKAGKLSGTFRAPNLQLAPLSFLTDQVVGLSGDLSVAGTLSGDTENPVITAQIFPSTINVAGTPLTEVKADSIQVRYQTATKSGEIRVPEFSLMQNGTQVAADDIFYNFSNGRFGANLRVQSEDIGVLLDTLRRSGLADSPKTASFVRSLNSLPYPVGGTFVLSKLAVSGRIANGEFTERHVVANLQARNLRVGDYSANTVDASASLKNDLVQVSNIQIVNDNTTIRGSGTADLSPQGEINALIETNQASLDLIRALPGQSGFPVRGQVDVAVRAQGLTRHPTITASLEGRDLVVQGPPAAPTPVRDGKKVLAKIKDVPPPDSQAPITTPSPAVFIISLLRAEGELTQDAKNGTHLKIPDIVLRSGGNEIRGEVDLPLNLSDPDSLIPPDQPLTLSATIGRFNLASLAKSLGIEGLEAEGDITGSVALGGTLAKPALDGGIRLAGGKLRLPRLPGTNRDSVNPISSLDVDIRLTGQDIDVRQLRVALGPPNGQKGDFGTVTAQGTVTLTNLQRLIGGASNPPSGSARRNRPFALQGSADMRVDFANLRPVLENVTGLLGESPTGLGEALRSEIDGTLFVKGPLTTFTVSTAPNQPLRLSKTYAQLPTRTAPDAAPGSAPTINPTLAVAIDFGKGVTIASPGTFALQAEGNVTANGQLFGQSGNVLQVQSTLTTTGGFFSYGLGQFKVQRGGDINLRLNAKTRNGSADQAGGYELGVTVRNLAARQKFYNRNPNAPTLAARVSDPTSVFGSTQPPTATRSNGYTITVRVDGPLLLGDQSPGIPGQDGPTLTFTSDPYLSRDEILALIGTKEQIELAAKGNIQQALSSGLQQTFSSTVVPRLLAPLEGQVQSALGLEDFGVEYNLNAPITLHLTKRLPDPFDRFLIDYTRSISTRSQSTNVQPYTFRLSYELYQLRQTRGVLPRLQIGIQLDDQRSFTTFLQGTINY